MNCEGKILFILQGPPCSGKSTWAKEYQEKYTDTLIANRDSIRYLLGEGKYVQDREDEVTKIEIAQVKGAMAAGRTVVLDDTNLNPKYLQPWLTLAEENGYEVKNMEFYVPYGIAMERSKRRKAEGGLYIPRNVMERFYKKYYKDEFEKEMTDYRVLNMNECNKELPSCVICDLDGTLAMHTGRTPFEWERMQEDKIDWRMKKVLRAIAATGDEIIFLTGRQESVRDKTELWLDTNFKWKYKLIMRPQDQFGKGNAVKKELYEKYIKGKYNVTCVFDDANNCVEMWRNEGLLTLQVQNADY